MILRDEIFHAVGANICFQSLFKTQFIRVVILNLLFLFFSFYHSVSFSSPLFPFLSLCHFVFCLSVFLF